jgi:mitogen-activated protein kinase 15
MSEIDIHILRKYQIIKFIGKGTYGNVWKAKAKRVDVIVAIKKISDAFINKTDA